MITKKENIPIDYKELRLKCLELIDEIKELQSTIHYYRESIETYKRAYNTVKQELKDC